MDMEKCYSSKTPPLQSKTKKKQTYKFINIVITVGVGH